MMAQVKALNTKQYLHKNIAVLSDIHSNLTALDEAISHFERERVELVVILGDLLTYGCQGNAVLTRLKELEKQYPCYFIIGNHDEFYFDLQGGADTTRYKLPPFIKESVDWTITRLQVRLIEHFDWFYSLTLGPVLLSHANPYGPGNWTYLNDTEECRKAADVLRQNSMYLGIFGHTHRKKNLGFSSTGLVHEEVERVELRTQPECGFVVNPGSVGQPRGEGASFLIFNIDEYRVELKHIELTPDLNDYFALVEQSGMGEETIRRLLSYFGVQK